MKVYCIIVAGGSGKRMGTKTPKQFLLLNGKPLLMHTIERLYNSVPQLSMLVVLPSEQIQNWQQLISEYNFKIDHEVVVGGDERFFSVKNALNHVPEEFQGIIAIHDGVRPMVSSRTIENSIKEASVKGTAIPVISLKESVRKLGTDGISVHVDRSLFKLVQTPQCFKSSIIKKAYQQDFNTLFTDDASVVESAGFKVNLVEGNVENIKITSPDDLVVAEALFNSLKANGQS